MSTIIGTAGADTLFGGAGNDSIVGAAGADAITAGGGNDRVILNDGDLGAGVVHLGGTACRIDTPGSSVQRPLIASTNGQPLGAGDVVFT